MSFQASFLMQQSLDGKTLRVIDKSVYEAPDALSNFSARSISLIKFDGTSLQSTDPIPFPIVEGTDDYIEIPLDKDYALKATFALTPVSSQSGSIYSTTVDTALLGFSKSKLYDRESRLLSGSITCHKDYADVNYTILRWINDARNRAAMTDPKGSQRFLDKINTISVNDCVC